MRIIGGDRKRRRLAAPAGVVTRPMLDRVRQAVFDALGCWYGTPARLPPLAVLDLYCGSGSLGIEALSRGARSCVFVERERQALKCLRDNLAALRLEDAATVIAADAESVQPPPSRGSGFDLVFLDPPFPVSAAAGGGAVARVLARLGTGIPVRDGALCLWRYEAGLCPPDAPAPHWRTHARRRYGRSAISWLVFEQASRE